MRIRRRPQSIISLQHSSDPSTSTAPQTPLQNAARSREWVQGGKDDEEGRLQQHHANVDLGKKSGVARRLALPQDNGVDCSKSQGAERVADDGTHSHRSLVNGHGGGADKDGAAGTGGDGSEPEPAAEVGEPVSNGAAAPVAPPAMIVAAKDEKSGGGGGAKKRRGGPAVLMEGSRCSRVNGRGWRCSQPTLVGYALCEHHLGKGRMRSVTGGRGGGAGSQLGRTEHRARVPAAAPNAEQPGPRFC